MSFEVEPIIELVKAKEQEATAALSEVLDNGKPYGQKRPTNQEIVQFLYNMLEEYPYQWWVDEETGEQIFVSPWLEVLKSYNDRTDKDKHLDGGKEVYNRIEKALQNYGGS